MNTEERRTKNQEHRHREYGHGADSMMAMMALMMVMCLGVVLLFSVVPTVGLPLGILIGLGGGVLMVFLHNRFMGHSGH
jgi:hypothetical protein